MIVNIKSIIYLVASTTTLFLLSLSNIAKNSNIENIVLSNICTRVEYIELVFIHSLLNINKSTVVLQKLLLENVTNWSERRPAFVHGHFAFINFAKFVFFV